MPHHSIFEALLLGLLEGLTEFIPVSSTGHLLLAGHFLGFNSPGKTFEVLIQLGAILAILSVYSARCCGCCIDLPRDPRDAPLRARQCCSPSCRRRSSARSRTIHQDGAVRDRRADLHHADRGRHRSAFRRPHASSSRAITMPWTSRSRWRSASASPSAWP